MASLFQQWNEKLENLEDSAREAFISDYYELETEVYKRILSQPDDVLSGTFEGLAEQYGFDHVCFAGFMDGINDSLKQQYEIDTLAPESEISLEVDFEKLYWNMLEAKAPWLYELTEWDNVFSADKRKEINKEHNRSKQAISQKVDRNAPCPCGSGKKYKKCCGAIG